MTDQGALNEQSSHDLVMRALDSIGGPQSVYRNPRMAFAFNAVRNIEFEGYAIEVRYGEISTPAIATVQGWVWEIHDQDIELLMKPRSARLPSSPPRDGNPTA